MLRPSFRFIFGGLLWLAAAGAASAADGLVAVKSAHPPKTTLDRFEAAAKERGLVVFARIDHAAGAQRVGKSLVWEDAQGQSWLGYNDPAWLAQRHGAASCPVVENLRRALSGLAEAATSQ